MMKTGGLFVSLGRIFLISFHGQFFFVVADLTIRTNETEKADRRKCDRLVATESLSCIDKSSAHGGGGATLLRGAMVASHPAAPGLIPSVPEFFLRK